MADERRQLDELLAAVDARLAALLAPVARDLARLVRRAPRRGGTVSPAGRQGLAGWLDATLAALFGDSPAGAEGLYARPGTVPHLLAAATRAAARLAAAPIVADARARLAGRPDLLAALAGGGGGRRTPPPGGTARAWVDPNGYRLSDRLWRAGEDVRTAIDTLLDYHIGIGSSAPTIEKELLQYLTPEGLKARTSTPYGRTNGVYAPLRLARTETTRAYGVATIEAARANPFVRGIRWNLSASHPAEDACDANASRDDHGLGRGVYPVDKVPRYPNHPQDKCYLTQVTEDGPAAAARLRAILAGGGDGLALDEAAIAAMVTGFDAAGVA